MIINVTMNKSVTRLIHQLVLEAISASKSYMKNEKVREELQAWVVRSIANGKITNDADLADFFSAIDMSVKALKMIPFDIFARAPKKR